MVIHGISHKHVFLVADIGCSILGFDFLAINNYSIQCRPLRLVQLDNLAMDNNPIFTPISQTGSTIGVQAQLGGNLPLNLTPNITPKINLTKPPMHIPNISPKINITKTSNITPILSPKLKLGKLLPSVISNPISFSDFLISTSTQTDDLIPITQNSVWRNFGNNSLVSLFVVS